jgi:hypothetical protein
MAESFFFFLVAIAAKPSSSSSGSILVGGASPNCRADLTENHFGDFHRVEFGHADWISFMVIRNNYQGDWQEARAVSPKD